MIGVPEPHSPLPWTQATDVSAIFDANGELVSFVQNAPFIMWLVTAHHGDYKALFSIFRIASAGQDVSSKTIAGLALGQIEKTRRVRL